jgi:DNA end-binding protein Ku
MASLTISFGLVSIPVKLYSATQSRSGISFNLLHKDCGSRLRQQYLCIKEGTVVERADMVKGYEFAKDQYVTFTPEELKEVEEKGTGAVDILQFVPEEKIDPVYYDKAYYLAPDKGGSKPYALLAAGMRKTGLCALGRWAARGKQYIVQLRPVENALVMQQLLYGDEVRSVEEIEIQAGEVKGPELDLAVQLIEQIATDEFQPDAFKDEVKERIEAAVEKKIKGQEISISTVPEGSSQGAQVIDLMQALRASLSKAAPLKSAEPATKSASRKPPKRAPPAAAGARRKSGT